MNKRNGRRGLLFGAVVVATVLAVASAAFACTGFRGRLRVTFSDGDWVEAVGVPTGTPDHTHCGITSSGTPRWGEGPTPNKITVTASREATCNGSPSNLFPGIYSVNFLPQQLVSASNVHPLTGPLLHSVCMNANAAKALDTGQSIPLGYVDLLTKTTDTKDFTAPIPNLFTDTIANDSKLCIGSADGQWGNQVPITIL